MLDLLQMLVLGCQHVIVYEEAVVALLSISLPQFVVGLEQNQPIEGLQTGEAKLESPREEPFDVFHPYYYGSIRGVNSLRLNQ